MVLTIKTKGNESFYLYFITNSKCMQYILCNIRHIVLRRKFGARPGNWEMPIVLSNLIGTRAKEMNLAVRVLYRTSTSRSIHR